MSTPQTVITVCSGVRLNSRYEHSIAFDSLAEQKAFFMGRAVKTFTAYSYVRKSWTLKVAATMEEAKTWNYLFFENGTGTKTYYYFINNVEYLSDNHVELTLEIDVLQTYQFDYTLLPCFVERQHTETDVFGEHTIDEGVDIGEITTNSKFDVPYMQDLAILMLSTINPEGGTEMAGGEVHGVYTGLGLYAVHPDNISEFAAIMEGNSDVDGVVSMWMYPVSLIETLDDWDEDRTVHIVSGVVKKEQTVKVNDKLDGYTPKNKKMLCYPYNMLYMTNNCGNTAVYKYERFILDNNKCRFSICGSPFPDGGIRIDPLYYNGTPYNFDEGVTLGGYPTCAWDADLYKIWLAQNQNMNQLAMGTGNVKVAAGAVTAIAGLFTGGLTTGAGLGMMTSGLTQTAELLATRADKALQPPQGRGQASANINVVNNTQTFSFYFKSVNAETARVIDDYFTKYGYKVNRIQYPNPKARPHFTFIKTIGCHIDSYLCEEDAVKIESIFDNGVTFWREGNSIGNYFLNNTPV